MKTLTQINRALGILEASLSKLEGTVTQNELCSVFGIIDALKWVIDDNTSNLDALLDVNEDKKPAFKIEGRQFK